MRITQSFVLFIVCCIIGSQSLPTESKKQNNESSDIVKSEGFYLNSEQLNPMFTDLQESRTNSFQRQKRTSIFQPLFSYNHQQIRKKKIKDRTKEQ